MINRLFLFLFFLFSISLVWADSQRPNVLVILTDDQGWGDISCLGNTNLNTPNIDTLASQGVYFDRFFVCPLCSPTRAEFLTGRYHVRGNVMGVSGGRERLDLEPKTIADMFQEAGYTTVIIGKWHSGSQYPYHPAGRGFQEFYGISSGGCGNYFDPLVEHNGKIVKAKGYIADAFTDKTLEFLEKNKDQPFFCYLAYNTPHSPWLVPDEYWDRFTDDSFKLRGRNGENESLLMTRCALAMCENVDWNVGRLMKKLEELNLDKNTIVIYFSDNGPNSDRWNGGMKGAKSTVEEGGVRVPFFIRWPGKIPAGKKVPQIAGGMDLLPTLAKLTNLEPLGTLPLDGIDITPLIFGDGENWPDRTIVSMATHRDIILSIRNQQYRYVETGDQLFDMVADPGQQVNITKRNPEVHDQMVQALEDWKKSVDFASRDEGRRLPIDPFPVGYSEFPWTPLPARDATFKGQVRRSAGAANGSFVTNWTSSNDKIMWKVDVHTEGEYKVAIHYTCAADDVGSSIELRYGDEKLVTKITEAHDPPLLDQWRRAPSGESFQKYFKEMPLGTIHLKKGSGTLELSAPHVAGKEVADFWGISLTLLEGTK